MLFMDKQGALLGYALWVSSLLFLTNVATEQCS